MSSSSEDDTEGGPAYFVMHSTSTLRVVKVGTNVLVDKNGLMKGVPEKKKRTTHFYATFIFL